MDESNSLNTKGIFFNNYKKFIFIGGFIVVFVLLFVVFQAVVSAKAEEKVNKKLAELERETGLVVSYDNLKTGFLGKRVTLQEVTLEQPRGGLGQDVHLQAVTLHRFKKSENQNFPAILEVSFHGFKLPVETMNQQARYLLKNMDYKDNLVVDSGISVNYNEKNEHLNINSSWVDVRNLGKLKFSLSIKNILLNESVSLQQWANIVLDKAKLTFENQDFLERFYGFAKKEEDLSKDEAIKQLMVQMQAARLPETFLQSLETFMQQEDELSVSVDPERSFTLQRIIFNSNPDQLVKQLNMSFDT